MINKIKRYSLLGTGFASLMLVSDTASAQTLGDMFDNISLQMDITSLLSILAYVIGTLFVATGLFKLQKHVDMGPQAVQLPEPLKFLGAGGIFLGLPSVAGVVQRGFGDQGDVQGINSIYFTNTSNTANGGGLDNMLQSFVQDAYGPFQNLLVVFCYIAAAILMIIAVHRFTKTAQEGPRGPSGMGTIATFVLAGALFSFTSMIGVFTETLFGDRESRTVVAFLALSDASADTQATATNVMTAILAFLIIVGILSMLRGFFVLRGVAEGNQQTTMMGGLSHVIAGAILVNFGEFANIIQRTLGIDSLGVSFL